MANIPAQHGEWVTDHGAALPLVGTPPNLFDIYSLPTEVDVDFTALSSLSNETKAELVRLRTFLRANLTKSEWPKNITSLQKAIMDYLLLLPAGTGSYLKLPWKHHMNNTSAELERYYLTFDLAYLYLYESKAGSSLAVRKEKLKSSIEFFKNACLLVPTQQEWLTLAENMASIAWILHSHLELEERIQGISSKMDIKSQTKIISTCYVGLSLKWEEVSTAYPITLVASFFWKAMSYYASSMAIFCRSLAEYYACRLILLDPQEGVTIYYPSFTINVNLYRGLLLSRLMHHVQTFDAKIVKPDILDKLSLLSKHNELVLQIDTIRTSLVESCFKPLLTKLSDYNRLVSHDPIPSINDIQFKIDSKPLPVTSIDKFQPATYLIAPAVSTAATLGTLAPSPTLLTSVVQKLSETFNPNVNATNTLIQSELESLDLVLVTDPEWIALKMDLVDIIKHRQSIITKIPPQQRAICEAYERMMLYLLHSMTQMPRSLLIFIRDTVHTESMPYYESLVAV